MKRVSLLLTGMLAISLVLAGCGSKTSGNAINSSSSTNTQNTAVNNSSSNEANPATSSSNAVGNNQLAMEAYKTVLQNKSKFYDTDNKKNVYLNNFLANNGSFDGVFKATHLAILDMDGDKMPEVVIELAVNNNKYPDFYVVLHFTNNEVQGYIFGIRSLGGLKADGSFGYSNGAADNGYGKLRFQNKTYKMDTVANMKSSENQEPALEYFINNKSVTTGAYESFRKEQEAKKDATWYVFSSENIETQLSIQ